MENYLSRQEIQPVDRIPRIAPAVFGATVTAQAGGDTAGQVHGEEEKAESAAIASEAQLASAAEYARIHAQIAETIAQIRSEAQSSAMSAAETEARLVSFLPAPVVIIPLPPANKDMVERAAMLAKEMAAQVAITRSAQAHLKPGTVDQILATVA